MVKIAIIGAGSVVFTKNLVNDFFSYPEFEDCELWLMDIDTDRLDTAYAMVESLKKLHGISAKIYKTLNRTEALAGARFIINTIQVGGLHDTLTDFDIPEKYGLRQTIGDTHGIAAVFRALRTIPEVLKVARDIEAGCPKDAILLNYSNPMAMVTWSVFDYTDVNVVGLCHSIQGTARQLASYMGVDYSDLRYRAGGINHIDWFLELEIDGQDAYPRLREAMKDPEVYARDKVRFEMMKMFGYFVSESSEHMSEYTPYFIKEPEKIETLDIPIREYVRRCYANDKTYQETRKLALSGGLDEKGANNSDNKKSVEYASKIMHAVMTGDHTTIHGNVKNTGLIPNLPDGCCVEVPVLVNKNGLQPTYFGKLPPQLAGLIRWHVSIQELAVRAAVEKRKDYVYQAALLDPLANSMLRVDDIIKMVDEMFEAYSELTRDYG